MMTSSCRLIASFVLGLLLVLTSLASAQTAPGPAPGTTCVVSALNRNATMQGDYYIIPGVPVGLGVYRVRAACSDGTVGQSALVNPDQPSDVLDAGSIQWGSVTPIPAALVLGGPANVNFGQTVQMTTTAQGLDGRTANVTPMAQGTNYKSSAPWIASIGQDGLLTVAAATYSGAPTQVVISATNEGTSVARLIKVGPRGRLSGKVTQADGRTAVAGAQVTIQLNAPLSVLATPTTGADGAFLLAEAPAGDYTVSVFEPVSGGRATASATVGVSGATVDVPVRLSGMGNVQVSVLGPEGKPAGGVRVQLTHAQFQGVFRALQTDGAGSATATGFTAGKFSVTVVDPASGAVALGSGTLADGAIARLELSLQAVGILSGHVRNAGGAAQAGVQVRLLADGKGLVTQAVTGADGAFRFDALPVKGAYLLQAVNGGQLGASKGGIVLGASGQEVTQDLVLGSFAAGGVVGGRVTNAQGLPQAGVAVTLSTAGGRELSATTDALGVYQITGVPQGGFSVSARGADGANAQAQGTVHADGEQLTIDLQLRALGRISGVVTLSSGVPAAQATVRLRTASGTAAQVSADGQGAYAFDAVPLGRYVLDASDAAGTGERLLLNDVLGSAGEVHDRPLGLVGVAPLKVRVVRGAAPVAGVRVSVAGHGPVPFGAQAMTDADGVAQFPVAPLGVYFVVADESGSWYGVHARLATVLRPDSPVPTIDLATEGKEAVSYSVTGRLLDASGVPIPNQWVRLSSRDMPTGGTALIPFAGGDEYLVPTDEQGRFSFDNVALDDDGRDRLKLDGVVDGLLAARAIVTTPDGRSAVRQDLALFTSGAVLGQVTTGNGRSVAAMPVRAVAADDVQFAPTDFAGTSDSQGRYVLARVPAGDFLIAAQDNASRAVPSQPGAIHGEGQVVRLDVVTAGSTILRGSLLGFDSKLVAATMEPHVDVLDKQSRRLLLRIVPDQDGGFVAAFDGAPRNAELDAIATTRFGQALVATQDASLLPDQELRADLRLPGTGAVRVALRYSDGTAVANNLVQLAEPGKVTPYGAFTDDKGVFRFDPLAAGTYTLRYQVGGVPGSQQVTVTVGQTTPADVSIPVGSVKGRVSYGDGRPVAGHPVQLATADGSVIAAAGTDADGRFLFDRAIAGERNLVLSEGSFQVSEPVSVTAGTTVERDLVLRIGSIQGKLLFQGGLAAGNAMLSLVDGGGREYRRVATDAQGQFSFADVGAGSYSAREAYTGRELASGVLVGDGASLQVQWTLAAGPAVTLRVNRANGRPLAGALVYGQYRNLLGTTNADGIVGVNLSDCYGGQFTAAYPGQPALEVRSPNQAWDCSQPQQVALQFPAVASLHVAASRNGAPLAGVHLAALDWHGAAAPQLPTTAADGTLDVDGLLAGSYTIEATAPDGHSQRASFTVGAGDDGTVVSRQFDFSTETDRIGRLGFDGERHLWSVPLKAGDKLAVTVHGAAASGTPALYNVRAEVFLPEKVRLASGYGYGSQYNYSQENIEGDLKHVTAEVDGNYPIAVQAQDAGATGGYQLALEVNGQPVQAMPYQDGGTLKGKVLRGDGVTPAPGLVVDLQSADTLALHVRTTSDDKGNYQFEYLPLAALNLALYEQDKVAGGAQATLEQAGQVLEQDLRLQAVTGLDITVSIDPALPLPEQMFVQLTDAAGTRDVGPVVFAGNRTSQVFSTTAAGDSIMLQAVHPYNSTVAATQTVTAADGRTVPVQLELIAVGLSGRVLDGEGQPVPYTWVYVWNASDHGWLGGSQSNERGEYVVTGLPTGVDLLVSAYNNNNGVTATLQVPALSTPNLGGQDIRFPASGSISGKVGYTTGAPIANAAVQLTGSLPYITAQSRAVRTASVVAGPSGEAFTIETITDADGNFQFGDVPAGLDVKVLARAPGPFGGTQEATAVAVARQDLRLPAFLFERGAALKIDVLDGDHQRNPLLYRPTIGECGSNYVQLTTSQGSVRLGLGGDWPVPSVARRGAASRDGDLADGELEPVLNVPHGPATVEFFDACSDNGALATAQVDINSDADFQVALAVPIVRGIAQYAPGVPLPRFYVSATQARPNGGERWYYNVIAGDSDAPAGAYAFVGLTPGEFTLRLWDDLTWTETLQQATLGPQGNLTYDMPVPYSGPGVIVGVATYDDGTPLGSGDVVLYQGPYVRHGWTAGNGSFAFAAEEVQAGPFEITVQDRESGLTASVSGTVVADKVNAANVRLPPTVGIAVRLRTASGDPVIYSSVYLSSASLPDFTPTAWTDWEGNAYFPRVGLGSFTLLARAPDTGLVVIATGSIDTPGQDLSVDLVVPAGAAVSGRVLDATGSTPVADAEVTLQTVRDFGAFDPMTWTAWADAGGNFSLPQVQPGAFRLMVVGDGGAVPAGVAEGTVADGASANVDIVLGKAASLPSTLAGADGSAYGLTCNGSIQNAGRPFLAEAFGLRVNGRPLPCTPAVRTAADRRELFYGPTAFGDGSLEVARRVFAPAAGGFARFIDTYVNKGSTEQKVTAVVGGGQLGYYAPLVADPMDNGQTFAVLGQPAFAVVFGGAGGAPNPADVFSYGATLGNGGGSDSSFGYQWTFTVPPGGKLSLMHFAVLAASTADAQVAARMLSTNAASSMFDGIAPDDKAAIVNFKLP